MDPSILTEGLRRLSVVLVLLSTQFLVACSEGDSPDLQARAADTSSAEGVPWGDPRLAEEMGLLWDTPPLPSPMILTVDGVEIPAEISHSHLLRPWTTLCADEGFGLEVSQLTEAFLRDPQELFRPLIRGVVLLREAENRFPKLNEEEVLHFQEQMELAVGTTMEALLNRYGQDGWERHVVRRLRLRLLHDEFSRLAPEVTEEEVYALYDSEVLAKLPNMDPAVGEDVSFEALAPKLRLRLELDRATELQEAWIDAEMEGLVIELQLPGDRTEKWVEHSPEAPTVQD